MNNKAVVFKKLETIGIITLHQSDDNNIAMQLSEEMAEICYRISIDETVLVVVVTGDRQGAFVLGFEPVHFKKKTPLLPSIARPVAELACPTIAAINGDAIGQGLELALACDIRIATNGASFCIPHIMSGLIPWDGATQRLLRTIGFTKTMEMVLTGEMITALEALRIGLVSKVVSDSELIPAAEEIAKAMAQQSPLAMRFAKEAVAKGMDLTLEQGLRLEADLYFLLQNTEDRIEGIKAFRGRRSPKFKCK
jgi:enoyl-CoA hydratase